MYVVGVGVRIRGVQAQRVQSSINVQKEPCAYDLRPALIVVT
jgi:hypothetical protein